VITKPIELPVPPNKNLMQHHLVCNRTILQDVNTLVEAVPFTSVGRIQPFHINITSSVTLLIDFHCHLTTNEVCGYLGGKWDFNAHNLMITHAFPMLNSRFDREKSSECEYEIQKSMVEKNIQLVGWYHSHPRFSAQPTVRDCDKQLDYQLKLRGTTDATYTPCVGFIFSSYDDDENVENETKIMPFWVLPPPENRPNELGRPLVLNYNIQNDEKLPDGIKEQMSACVNYYKQFQYELVNFSEMKIKEDALVLEKMKNSLFFKFPLEDQKSGELWNWILELLELNSETPIIIPKKILERQRQLEEEERAREEAESREKALKEQEIQLEREKREREQEAAKQALNAISCLQQQLNQPSGLNMNPSPISTLLTMTSLNNNSTSNKQSSSSTNASSSPRDSPATIPSNAPSPAKFEIPVRASPSPARSDTSSIRGGARNSPAPSPAKLPIERPPRNSSSGSSKYDLSGYSSNNLSDLYAATLSSFAKSLPPGLLPNDYASLLQNPKLFGTDFGLSALGSLQASAAALSMTQQQQTSLSSTSGGGKKKSSGSQLSQSHKNSSVGSSAPQSITKSGGNNSSNSNNTNSWLSQIPNMKEFMNQLEKGDLSVLMQSPYNIPTCKPTKGGGNASNKSQTSSSARTSDYSYQEGGGNNRDSLANKRKGRPPNTNAPATPYDYDLYKSDVGKISDLMKSPEYTQMLMNQANAFRGLGSEITVTRKPSTSSTTSSSSSGSKKSTVNNQTSNQTVPAATATAAANSASLLNRLPIMDLNYLAEISKSIPELNALLNSNKPEDINALLQMQMMAKNMDYATAFFSAGSATVNSKGSSTSSSTAKAIQELAANSSILSQYMSGASNLFNNPMYPMSGGTLTSLEKTAKELSSSRKRDNNHANSGSLSTSSRSQSNLNVAPNAADMLNSLFAGAASKSSHSSHLLPPDLNAYFSSPSSSSSSSGNLPTNTPQASSSSKVNHSSSGGGIIHGAMDYSSLFSHMTPSKLQEMTSLFSQSTAKYPGIPDPLAKSTLAANNAYLSPSLMKLQQEALNTQLMKPPKSSSSSTSSKIETPPPIVSSPMSDKRSTPTKSMRDSPVASLPKYNFSAADLAISSHAENSRKSTTPTSPIDLKERIVPPKKRMEFSSIAELVAPSPSKRQKFEDECDDDDGGALNLSKN
jgi:MPN domain-containing protein